MGDAPSIVRLHQLITEKIIRNASDKCRQSRKPPQSNRDVVWLLTRARQIVRRATAPGQNEIDQGLTADQDHAIWTRTQPPMSLCGRRRKM